MSKSLKEINFEFMFETVMEDQNEPAPSADDRSLPRKTAAFEYEALDISAAMELVNIESERLTRTKISAPSNPRGYGIGRFVRSLQFAAWDIALIGFICGNVFIARMLLG